VANIGRGLVEMFHDFDRRARPGREPRNRAISKFQTLLDTVTFSSETVTTTVQTPPYQYARESYRNAVMADTPRAYWRLNEFYPAVTAYDEQAAYYGTYATGVFPGRVGPGNSEPGTAVAFPGTSSARVDGPTTALSIDVRSAFTVELWVRPNAIVTGQTPFAKFITAPSRNGVYIVAIGGTNFWNFNRYYAGTATVANSSAGSATTGWQHLVETYDGTTAATALRAYVNGQLLASGLSTGNVVATTGRVDIGAADDAAIGTIPFAGLIDEVATYTVALSSTRILAHYNAMTTPTATGTSLVVAAGQFR